MSNINKIKHVICSIIIMFISLFPTNVNVFDSTRTKEENKNWKKNLNFCVNF